MVVEKWIGFLILIAFFDTIWVITFYLSWVKKQKITGGKLSMNKFPFNANKKQSVIWFIIWSITIYLNIVVYTLLSWLLAMDDPQDYVAYFGAFAITAFIYSFLMGIIYVSVKAIVSKRLERQANNTRTK